MAKYSGEELDWLNKLETASQLLKADPNLKGVQLAEKLNCSPAHASYISSLNDCLDQAAIDKIRLAAHDNPPFILSFNSARALIRLNGTVADLPAAVHTVLDLTLSRRLKTNKIETLVESLVKEDSPEKELAQGLSTLPEDVKRFLELAEKLKGEIARNAASPDGDKQTTYQDELRALLKKGTVESEEDENSGKKGKAGKKTKSASQNEPSLFWEWILGVKFMSQLKSKAKKGELTTNDKLLILADKGLIKPAGWLLEKFGKLFKKMGKGLWHAVEEAAGQTIKKILAVALPLLFMVGILWAVLAFFHFAVISPWHWVEHKIGSMFHADSHNESAQSSPVSQPVASTQMSPAILPKVEAAVNHLIPKKNGEAPTPVSAPVMTYQPAISFQPAIEDPKILDFEISSLPDNCVVKDHTMTPDETMPGDVAVSRMQEVTDRDKYAMLIGGGKQIISVVNANSTGLEIDYKSADPFGNILGGGKSPMNFLWEDVKTIHINEIDHFSKPGVQPDIKYQMAVVVKGAKFPLTFQCDSTDDLENLVSTMEYFIRHSRLARDAQPAGMPYPHQGLVFTNDGVVKKLWADSPADKAGAQLGDHLWSVGKATSDQQDKKVFEKVLSSLPVTLFAASPEEWTKAKIAAGVGANDIHPRLRKIVLVN